MSQQNLLLRSTRDPRVPGDRICTTPDGIPSPQPSMGGSEVCAMQLRSWLFTLLFVPECDSIVDQCVCVGSGVLSLSAANSSSE